MPSLSVVRAFNATWSPSYLPVGIFLGGTSGIGRGIAEAFARHTKGNAHIILVGRNRSAAESIISQFPKPTSPEAKHEFVSCDARLMRNVRAAEEEIMSKLEGKERGAGKVNFLVMSPGFSSTKGRDETEEGIDKKMAVWYYARWVFTQSLIPALLKAREDGEDAKVVSVPAMTARGKVDLDDLGLKTGYSLTKVALSGTTYVDLMMEEFYARHPSLTFIHAFPGAVRTSIGSSAEQWGVRAAYKVVYVLLRPIIISLEDCGEYMMYGILNTARTAGVWNIGSRGENTGGNDGKQSSTEEGKRQEERRLLWEHTVQETQYDTTSPAH